MKLGVLFGGKSTEHDVSISSGTSVIENLDKEKYEIYPIYIDLDGKYYLYDKPISEIKRLDVGSKISELKIIDNIVELLRKMDVVFPVLHGLYGEDGTIQGLLELLDIPYVGCGVLSSSICMDKVYTKSIFRCSNIKNAKSMYIKKYNDKYAYIDDEFDYHYLNSEELKNKVLEYLKYPVFIKPSNSGSSVGVHEANIDNLIEYLEDSFKYDSKVLIEEKIVGRELECAVLGNDDVEVSKIGEIINENTFYTFESKYISKSRTVIPVELDENILNSIRSIAKKAYKACDCKGLSRVDFFLTNDNEIYLNEINTMPGFTDISMYPKLMDNYGYKYSELLDKLIECALKK